MATGPWPRRKPFSRRAVPGAIETKSETVLEEDGGLLPALVAAVTDCGRKTAKWKKSVSYRMSEVNIGWEAKWQAEWNAKACKLSDARKAISHGWTIADTVTLTDGATYHFTCK